MTHVHSTRGNAPVQPSIEALVAEHGAWPVLVQAIRALVIPPMRLPRTSLDTLDDRLLRDIGLPPRPAASRDWRDLR